MIKLRKLGTKIGASTFNFSSTMNDVSAHTPCQSYEIESHCIVSFLLNT